MHEWNSKLGGEPLVLWDKSLLKFGQKPTHTHATLKYLQRHIWVYICQVSSGSLKALFFFLNEKGSAVNREQQLFPATKYTLCRTQFIWNWISCCGERETSCFWMVIGFYRSCVDTNYCRDSTPTHSTPLEQAL